jgi:multidrug efflux system membrane fusion protein
MQRSWIIAAIVAVGAVGWIASGQLGGTEAADQTAAQPAAIERPVPRVRVAELTAEPMINTIRLQGRTMAERKVELRAETSGAVAEVLVERGTPVEAGDVLVRLALNDRQARVTAAEALLEQRDIEFEAATSLNQRGYRADTQLAEARAARDTARAELERARLDLEHTIVRAPFAGIVDSRSVEVGDFVDIGDPIAMIIDLDPLRIRGQVSERFLGQVRPGQTGSVRLVDGSVHEGVITFVGAIAHESTRTVPVEVDIANPDNRIIEGLTAELIMPVRESVAHRVPSSILSLADDGTIGVKAVDDDNRVTFLPIEILGGSRAEGLWVGGLPDRLTVIVVGQDFVQPGEIVAPVLADDPALLRGQS